MEKHWKEGIGGQEELLERYGKEALDELGEDHEFQILHVGCAQNVDEVQEKLHEETVFQRTA